MRHTAPLLLSLVLMLGLPLGGAETASADASTVTERTVVGKTDRVPSSLQSMRDPRPAQSLEDVNRRAYDLQVIPPGFVHYPAFSDEQFATLTEVRILAKDAVRRHPDAVMMEVDVEGSDPLVYQVLVLKTVVRIDAVVAADVRQDTMALLPPTPSPTSKGGAQPLQQTPALGANYYLTSSQRIFAGLRTADPSITTAEIADIYDAMKVIWSKDDDNRQDPHSTVILGGLLPDTRPRP